MKKTLKRLPLLLAGVFVSFAGCVNNNQPTTSNPTPSTTPSTVAPSTVPGTSVDPSSTPGTSVTPSTGIVTPPPENIDVDVRIEAETGIIAGSKLEVQAGTGASNGNVAAGLNDCGQGLFFVHYAPVGGNHDIEIGYFTENVGSKHELVVNGVAQTVTYPENTGWGALGGQPGKVTVTAELEQGYNVITLSKKGTASDTPEYGGWAQVDYLEIKGTGTEYDKDALVYNLDQIKVEAELGNFTSAVSCPVGMAEASNGYIIGEINDAGHGATYHLTFPESGRYALQIAYGKDAGARPIDIKLDETNYTYSLEDYAGQAWNNFHLSNTAAVLDITEGTHTLSITRAADSSWFCFDYFVLTKVEETVDVRVEAENCVIDGTRVKTADNAAASNGSMACDMNDCGQGLYFPFYSPVAGEFDLEVGYWTGAANSKQDVYVNGTKQTTIVYETANGWADGTTPAATVSTKINLEAGYNDISVIKYGVGSDSPEYGGWVQVDYFEIKGGKEYNPNVAVDKTVEMRIEAELGNYNSAVSCPVGMGEATNGYIVGEINAEGHGSTMKIRVPESGTYELYIVYGKGAGARPVNITLDETNYTYSLEDYDNQAWNVFHTSNVAATLTLDKDTVHTLSITRAAGSDWFCFDSIILKKVN